MSGKPTYEELQQRVLKLQQGESERKHIEKALNSEKERLAVTLRSIGDAVIATDRSGRITLINPIAEKLTGWPETEAKGRPLSEVFSIVSEMTGQPCPNPVQQVLETGKVQGLLNHTTLNSRDGNQYNVADSAAPILDPGQAIVGAVLVFRDITAAQRTEAELQKIEKLRSLGVLAGGMGGQETMARLTQVDKHVKAIVSSGYSNDPVMSNYREYGFISAVRKPYVIKELSDAMRKLK